MNCPKCRAPMEIVTYAEIVVDRCTKCRGLFFDALEPEKLKRAKGSEVIDDGDAAVGEKYDEIDLINCPRDTTRMVRMTAPRQYHLHFETCPVCFGTFFDAGEFRDWKEETLADVFRGIFAKKRA